MQLALRSQPSLVAMFLVAASQDSARRVVAGASGSGGHDDQGLDLQGYAEFRRAFK